MDLKALMQKLEVIDKKQNLMEAEKKETTWTDKSGKKHPATQVKGDKYTGKEAEKEDKKKADEGISFTSGIAQALLREFGLEEAPVTNPWANDPAKSAAWTALSPQDQAWLGGADPTDPYILRRAPNKGKSVRPAGMSQDAVDQARNATEPDAVAQAPTAAPTTGQAAQPSQDPAQDQYGNNIPISSTQTVTPDKAPETEPPKKQMAPVDPGTVGLQKWIASKGYDIGKFGADGRWGKDTTKAIDAFWADWKAGKISEPDKQQYQTLLGAAKDTNWTRYWFQKQKGGAAPDQMAKPAGGGQAAQPAPYNAARDSQAANSAPASGQAAQPAATAPTQSVAQKAAGGQSIIDQGREKLGLPAGGTAPASRPAPAPAPAPAGGQLSAQQIQAQKDIARAREKAGKVAPDSNGSGTLQGGQVARESVRNEDDAILQRIRNALHR